MRQPQSIRSHLAAVFLLFFALVVILGAFSIWRLSNFDALSADVAEVWLPTTRALGDLNNYTSDFRAFEGGELLSSDPPVAPALIHIGRSISAQLLDLAARMRRLAANDTDIDVPETKRTDDIGEMAHA